MNIRILNDLVIVYCYTISKWTANKFWWLTSTVPIQNPCGGTYRHERPKPCGDRTATLSCDEMIQHWYFKTWSGKDTAWSSWNEVYEIEEKGKTKRKRKVLVIGFRHMQGILFAFGPFLLHIQRKICLRLCHLPVCQQSYFLLTQGNKAIFSI